MVDYIGKWTARAELPAKRILAWMSLPTSKYHLWKQHYGRPHAHNSHIPWDGWLEAWEKQAIIDYRRRFPLDGYSRAIVHWEIRETMKEPDVETIVQRALEKYPGQKPRIISGNGPQFIAKDFTQFIRLAGITHVRTSPHYPQSNGTLERWHGTLKNEEFRNKAPRDVEEARRVVGNFVTHYNQVRLHSALGYITPHDMLAGRDAEIFASRDAKLEAARASRLGAKSRAAAQSLTQAVPA